MNSYKTLKNSKIKTPRNSWGFCNLSPFASNLPYGVRVSSVNTLYFSASKSRDLSSVKAICWINSPICAVAITVVFGRVKYVLFPDLTQYVNGSSEKRMR
jgi:hypothetical protein